jgi:GAF domain-containing protein
MTVQTPSGRVPPSSRLFDPSVHDEMIRSTVRLARLVFAAAAASVFLYDAERGELVFEASSGAGEDRLVGVAIPADRGIAGWVHMTGESIIVRDLAEDSRFDRDFAEATGHVPDTIMAAPLELDHEPFGVIEVLDPDLAAVGDLAAIDILAELARQSCAALSLLVAARRLRPADPGPAGGLSELGGLEARLRGDGSRDAEAVSDLVRALSRLIEGERED